MRDHHSGCQTDRHPCHRLLGEGASARPKVCKYTANEYTGTHNMAWFNLKTQKTSDVLTHFGGNVGKTNVGAAYIMVVRVVVLSKDN